MLNADGGTQGLQFGQPVATGEGVPSFAGLPTADLQPMAAAPRLVAQPAPVVHEDAAASQDKGPALADDEALLSDGRIVAVMETTPRHDEAVEKLLSQCGYNLTGLGPMAYTRAMAFCALYSIKEKNPATGEYGDPQPLAVPRTRAMWEERKDLITTTKDAMRIVEVYRRVNGDASSDDFRQ